MSFPQFVCLCLIGLIALIHPEPTAGGERESPPKTAANQVTEPGQRRLRRPVALDLDPRGKWLYVANRDSGSLSVMDTTNLQIVAESRIGLRLADVRVLPNGRHLLAADEQQHRLFLLAREGNRLPVKDTETVAGYPVRITVTRDGKQCFVASLWSRRLSCLRLMTDDPGTNPRMDLVKTIALPFPPRELLLIEQDSRLLVADSFGGHVAIVDVPNLSVERVKSLPAHNIRGLSLNADRTRILVSHQILNRLAHTSRDDIHWGLLMSNSVRSVRLQSLLAPSGNVLRDSLLIQLGDLTDAAGDPAGIAVSDHRKFVVCLAGVNEVAVGTESQYGLRRIRVGRRPTAVIASPDGSRAYVANTFADSISVVDLQSAEQVAMVALGPQRKLTQAEEGEMLFYDARLSQENWYSCHSCHTDGHTNGSRNDNFGDNSYGAPKRIPTLLGTGDTGPWAWNGSMTRLGEQIQKSIRTTMRGPQANMAQIAALTAYLKTLQPAPPLPELSGRKPSSVDRGRKLFAELDCSRCHLPPSFTSTAAYDVGLKDELGNTHFNPPSLRGISQQDAFFHDKRAKSLNEVFTEAGHQLQQPLSEEELISLIAFLQSL